MPEYELLLAGGTVIDPSQGLHAPSDVAVADGRIAAVGPSLPRAHARRVVDVAGKLVVPGLIDLHTHVYWGGSSLGVDPDDLAARSGVTTMVDAGSAGPGNFAGFRRHLIERARVRILPFLNISFPGIFAFSRSVMVGESVDLRLLSVSEAVRVAREHAGLVLGIKVRLGLIAGCGQGIAPLHLALQAADALGARLMVHTDLPPPTRREVLPLLRPGDIFTHAFRAFPNGPLAGPGGAGARRRDRHRTRHGQLLVRERRSGARAGVPAGRHQQRRPRPLHRRPGIRPADDDVEAAQPRDAAGLGDRRLHVRAGAGDRPSRPRDAAGGRAGGRDRAGRPERGVPVRRRHRPQHERPAPPRPPGSPHRREARRAVARGRSGAARCGRPRGAGRTAGGRVARCTRACSCTPGTSWRKALMRSRSGCAPPASPRSPWRRATTRASSCAPMRPGAASSSRTTGPCTSALGRTATATRRFGRRRTGSSTSTICSRSWRTAAGRTGSRSPPGWWGCTTPASARHTPRTWCATPTAILTTTASFPATPRCVLTCARCSATSLRRTRRSM